MVRSVGERRSFDYGKAIIGTLVLRVICGLNFIDKGLDLARVGQSIGVNGDLNAINRTFVAFLKIVDANPPRACSATGLKKRLRISAGRDALNVDLSIDTAVGRLASLYLLYNPFEACAVGAKIRACRFSSKRRIFARRGQQQCRERGGPAERRPHHAAASVGFDAASCNTAA